ncbi:MAG: hypothetical protein LAT62_15050 [Natronospirillum sp.]|uniref:hypothetical protein n=1 Tax=Natronospirillum sp. TaxID=2812955 RepID=UPI0025D5876B|nr:hypothetical protein [Natronospirillum sp.]MCH8553254.1 hypothetical protein [Natronospirillum sp.]
MTPREIAEPKDPEVLRETLRRVFISQPPDSERARIISEGSAEDLVALARSHNAGETRAHRRVKHGLLQD